MGNANLRHLLKIQLKKVFMEKEKKAYKQIILVYNQVKRTKKNCHNYKQEKRTKKNCHNYKQEKSSLIKPKL